MSAASDRTGMPINVGDRLTWTSRFTEGRYYATVVAIDARSRPDDYGWECEALGGPCPWVRWDHVPYTHPDQAHSLAEFDRSNVEVADRRERVDVRRTDRVR